MIRKSVAFENQYVIQRTKGVYIATLNQFEATFDFSFAVQVINPQKNDAKRLNKRIQWQMKNVERELRFVKLDTTSLKLIVFIDAIFANNSDYISQIDFVICLADGSNKTNLIHWSSTKCKKITRNVLIAELFAMTQKFDVASILKSFIEEILQISLSMIICTDFKSLYDCLVRLDSTIEKRLIIDIMCLRESYERKKITEIKWIDENNNPADAMTKSNFCRALEDLINSNTIKFQITGWVERESDEKWRSFLNW